MKYVKLSLLALAVIVPVLAGIACTAYKPQIDQSIAAAQKVSQDAAGLVQTAEQIATTLPAGPNRDAAIAEIAKVKQIQAQADAYIAAAKGVSASLDTGNLDPSTASAISLLPYGAYGVTAFSLVLAGIKAAKASGALTDLENVVKSWEAVGGVPLPHKDLVAKIQGPDTTAAVDAIKSALPPASPVASEPAKS